jgi:hypothetical protein
MDAGFPHSDRYDDLRAFALALPGVEEAPSHGGWPVLKVGKQFFMTLKEDGETLVLKIADDFERQFLLDSQPDIYYLTDHYRGWPGLLVRLPPADMDDLRELAERVWRRIAPKRAVKAYDTPKP